ncbi:MAG: exo-beta-N-acetylmuramidase NamZ domain-containing protein [Gemmatimonadota bacterium]
MEAGRTARGGTRPGIEVLLGERAEDFRGARLGLIAPPASVTRGLRSSVEALIDHPGLELAALFGPQHGIRGEKQDNMIESDSFRDPRTRLPVHSLYGDVRKPTPAMLDGIDVLLFDLQDVGVRVYTFVWTMTLAMEACRDAGVRFVVLDRPNPVGGEILEGAVLRPGYESFVGLHPVPLRHGLTAGELARVANEAFGIGADLDVVACEGWRRAHWFDDTGLPWVLPSPNLPTLDSAILYPGMVLLEGTNLSEGRGTTRPFEIVGAPYLRSRELAERLNDVGLPGVLFRPHGFEPTFNKHAGRLCGGVQIHVTDRLAFRPVDTAVHLLAAARDLAPEHFHWSSPPYEYEAEKRPIDILWGNDRLRTRLNHGDPADAILGETRADLASFAELAREHRIYD